MAVTTIYYIILTRIRHVTTNFGYYNIWIHIYFTNTNINIKIFGHDNTLITDILLNMVVIGLS